MSQTVTRLQHGTTIARPYDAVYDPVYKVSTTSSKFVPPHAKQSLAATRKSLAQTVQSSQTAAPAAAAQTHLSTAMEQDARVIVGSDRHKYFKRPVVAYMDAIPANVIIAPDDAQLQADNTASTQAKEEATRSAGVQTIYRESEAQTDPYTADYIISPDQQEPEVLALAHLTFGNGLPGALEEVQYVQKLREKRAFEASIPTGTDEESLRVRARLLEERELREWEEREHTIQEEQAEKLAALRAMLEAREEHVDLLNEARVARVREQAVMERDTAFADIHHQRLKAMRAIARAHEPSNKGKPRDIIAETADEGSRVYAPATRDGKVPVQNQVVDYGIPLLDSYQGLVALERALPQPTMRAPVTSVAAPNVTALAPRDRETQKLQRDLEFVHEVLTRAHNPQPKEKPVNIYKRFEPVVRPATPVAEKPANEDVARAALQVQRLIRGRAVQLAMARSKARASALIEELSVGEREEAAVDREALVAKEEADAAAEALDAMAGVLVTEALDFLTKEVVRVAEERKVAEFVARARDCRRVREVTESGRRQVEHALRKKREHALELVSAVHHETAARVLDDVFAGTVEDMAGAAAQTHMYRCMAEEQVKQTQDSTESTSARADSSEEMRVCTGVFAEEVVDPITGQVLSVSASEREEAEGVVRALLMDLVLPEVARQRTKREAEVKDRKFIASAHDAVAAIAIDVKRGLAGEARVSNTVPNARAKTKDV